MPNPADSLGYGRVAETLPAAAGATVPQTNRVDKYGSQLVNLGNMSRQSAAAEGSYFVTTNATIGTGNADLLNTAFSATKAFIYLFNQNSAASGINVYLDYLKLLLVGTAPATTTSLNFAVIVDSAARTPTAGSPATLTPVNPNMNSSAKSNLLVQVATGGANITVPTTTSTQRIAARITIPTSLGITGDEYEIIFGGSDSPPAGAGLTAVRATAAARLVSHAPPIILGPQQSCIIARWWLTETTNNPTFEMEMGHFEK